MLEVIPDDKVVLAARPAFPETRARIGLLLPSGNRLAEGQFTALLPPGVAMHTTRLRLTGSSEAELLQMAEKVEDAVSLVADAGVDLILFHCTAVSTFSPALEQDVLARMRRSCTAPVTATSEALVKALKAVGARRIVMLSPYIEAINDREAAYLKAAGFDILTLKGLGLADANAMAAVTPEDWKQFALANRHPDADAYLISCTTVRATEVAGELETLLGKPVVTSNTAAIWHCLRTLQLPDTPTGAGRLFSIHP
ncbi:MAG: arylmalonate decarboxylase [Polaromonas sp.]|nr:arylmalonate decarboxylase [Polaromonas sp.]